MIKFTASRISSVLDWWTGAEGVSNDLLVASLSTRATSSWWILFLRSGFLRPGEISVVPQPSVEALPDRDGIFFLDRPDAVHRAFASAFMEAE